ncbi:PF20097 family protein [Ruminococcus sp.]|uniref:PF20097 family protein n=1 Tax=Ruminococcus sp. TaxID=41978 RepID=UPI0025F51489|nr:PF20097 family protein [Ruminococcus sp.]
MKCPYCQKEMQSGEIELYEFASVLFHKPATLKFIPHDHSQNPKKAEQIYSTPVGWYCTDCNKIMAVFEATKPMFG